MSEWHKADFQRRKFGRPKLQLCRMYNYAQDCRFGDQCRYLHLCRFYVEQRCRAGVRCKRAHNINEGNNLVVLGRYGLDVERDQEEVVREIRQLVGRPVGIDHRDRPIPGGKDQAVMNDSDGRESGSSLSTEANRHSEQKTDSKPVFHRSTPQTNVSGMRGLVSASQGTKRCRRRRWRCRGAVCYQSRQPSLSEVLAPDPSSDRPTSASEAEQSSGQSSKTVNEMSAAKNPSSESVNQTPTGNFALCSTDQTFTFPEKARESSKSTGGSISQLPNKTATPEDEDISSIAADGALTAMTLRPSRPPRLKGLSAKTRMKRTESSSQSGEETLVTVTKTVLQTTQKTTAVKTDCANLTRIENQTASAKLTLESHRTDSVNTTSVKQPPDSVNLAPSDRTPTSAIQSSGPDTSTTNTQTDSASLESTKQQTHSAMSTLTNPTAAPGSLKPKPIETNSNSKKPSLMRQLASILNPFKSKKAINGSADKAAKVKESLEDQPEICIAHLEGVCRNGMSCSRYHCQDKYQWQKQDNSSKRWLDLTHEENREVEMSYCDPREDGCKSLNISFITMETMDRKKSQVRRISTISSCSQGDGRHSNYATKWVWYWLASPGQWSSYGVVDKRGIKSSIVSRDLETKFLKNREGSLDFKTGEHKYRLDFRTLKQKNLNPVYGTERDVRRRPSPSSPPMKHDTTPAPRHWNPRKTPETGYQLVDIPIQTAEYIRIVKAFGQTMKQHAVKKIQRVQNLELWDGFQRQKVWMERKLPERQKLDIRELFHGTKDEHIDAICRQGFDPRVSGTSSGTAYGQGSYFARNANYSRKYSSGNKMFLAKVLVGEYSRGDTTFKRPPTKNLSTKDMYDSCVNKVDNPTIFVIFKQEQAYPEWLIEYTDSS